MGYRAGGVITEETYEQYARYIRRWKEAGRPLPEEWFVTLTPETAHGARSALMWYHRETGGNVLELPALPMTERVPRALSVEQVAEVLDAMFSFNPRAGYTAALLYATGARVSEAVHIVPEDLSEKAVVLRHTKRRPGGKRIERSVPLGPRWTHAVTGLRYLPAGRRPGLVGASRDSVENWFNKSREQTARCLLNGCSVAQLRWTRSGLGFGSATARRRLRHASFPPLPPTVYAGQRTDHARVAER